jgi:hypothetical protein
MRPETGNGAGDLVAPLEEGALLQGGLAH